MQFTGRVLTKTLQITVGANNTPKISLIMEEDSEKQYKDSIMIDFVGEEKVALVDGISEGSTITVSFNTRATEYNGRHYNNLNGWRIEGGSSEGGNNQSAPAKKKEEKIEEDFDDLPF